MPYLGAAYALQGRLAEGRALLEEGISKGLSIGGMVGLPCWVAWLSEVCRLAGLSAEAWQHARRALDLARQQKARGNEALALHQLGVVQAHADPPDVAQAEASYQQDLALTEALGIRPLVAHCHRGLGTPYATIGKGVQARIEFSTAVDLYHAMEMTFWLPQTEAALAQVKEGCSEGSVTRPHCETQRPIPYHRKALRHIMCKNLRHLMCKVTPRAALQGRTGGQAGGGGGRAYRSHDRHRRPHCRPDLLPPGRGLGPDAPYAQTGVEAIRLVGLQTREQLEAVHQATSLPLTVLSPPPALMNDRAFLAANGIRVLMLGNPAFAVAVKALYDCFKHLKDGGALC